MNAVSESLMIHTVCIPQPSEAADLASTRHDHAERHRDEIETLTNGGALDFVVKGRIWKDINAEISKDE